jgi:hypothetical protein
MQETRAAYDAVIANTSSPSEDTFVAAILEVARLPLSRFARHPKLRNVCLAKILLCRNHPKANHNVCDALEILRVTLWQSLDHDDWVSDAQDPQFREAVSCHGLVYELEPAEFGAQSVLDEYESDEESEDFN